MPGGRRLENTKAWLKAWLPLAPPAPSVFSWLSNLSRGLREIQRGAERSEEGEPGGARLSAELSYAPASSPLTPHGSSWLLLAFLLRPLL